MPHGPIPDQPPEFDPETGYWVSEPIKLPPAACLQVHRRHPLWRRLLRQRPITEAMTEGDTITFPDSGKTRVIDRVEPTAYGSVNVLLKPSSHPPSKRLLGRYSG
jgi:hypothetical protein